MDPQTQAIFFGLALLFFAVAVIVSVVRANPPDRFVSLDWTALGLAFWVFVPLVIALRAS